MIKLNIGSGGIRMAGYVSIDLHHKDAEVNCDCADTGYENESVSEIYTSHMIEHIDYDHFIKALKHWHHILISAGTLIIRCPNAELYIKEWLDINMGSDWELLSSWGTRNLLGWQNKGSGMLNRQLFTSDYLRWIVVNNGFSINQCEIVETRTINKKHIEYRKDGDIMLIGHKVL